MTSESDAGTRPQQSSNPTWPGFPTTPGEFVTLIAHYYRGELARMAGWRDRIDRTSNWAITVVGAMLSLSLSTTAHHGIILFAMVLVLLLLVIESRRYQFFDVYRNRVRKLERQYYAEVFWPTGKLEPDWMRTLSDDLKSPLFMMSLARAITRRLRRNYFWMFLILLIAWVIKITTPQLTQDSAPVSFSPSLSNWFRYAEVGPLPGWTVTIIVVLFYVWVIYASVPYKDEGELTYGDVQV